MIAPPIKIVREPWGVDMLLETRVDSDRHAMVGWVPWMESLRDRVGNPRLFLMRNRESERFSICHWVWGPMDECPSSVRVASEIEGFEGNPGQLGWPTGLLAWPVLVARMSPAGGPTLRQQFEGKRRAKAARTREMMERRDATAQRLRRMGAEDAARDVGRRPYMVGEGHEEIVDTLCCAATTRVSRVVEKPVYEGSSL